MCLTYVSSPRLKYRKQIGDAMSVRFLLLIIIQEEELQSCLTGRVVEQRFTIAIGVMLEKNVDAYKLGFALIIVVYKHIKTICKDGPHYRADNRIKALLRIPTMMHLVLQFPQILIASSTKSQCLQAIIADCATRKKVISMTGQ